MRSLNDMAFAPEALSITAGDFKTDAVVFAEAGERDARGGGEGAHHPARECGGEAGAEWFADEAQAAANDDHFRMQKLHDMAERKRHVVQGTHGVVPHSALRRSEEEPRR